MRVDRREVAAIFVGGFLGAVARALAAAGLNFAVSLALGVGAAWVGRELGGAL